MIFRNIRKRLRQRMLSKYCIYLMCGDQAVQMDYPKLRDSEYLNCLEIDVTSLIKNTKEGTMCVNRKVIDNIIDLMEEDHKWYDNEIEEHLENIKRCLDSNPDNDTYDLTVLARKLERLELKRTCIDESIDLIKCYYEDTVDI